MTDVLERLRADNPVDAASPPAFDELWERVQRQTAAARGPRARPARVLVIGSLALIPVVLVAAALLAVGHTRATRRSAVAATAATILHYRLQTIYGYQPIIGGRREFLQMSDSDVWVSGQSVRVITSRAMFNPITGRRVETRLRETVTNGRRSVTFSADSLVGKGTLSAGSARVGGTPCGAFFNPVALSGPAEFCGAAFLDPAGALRQLYERRKLKLIARDTRLPGGTCPRPMTLPATSPTPRCRLDELKLPYPGWVVMIFVRPGTFIPVLVTAQQVPPPEMPSLQRIVAGITEYQRLPLTRSTRSLLQMPGHPSAQQLCADSDGCD